ncbi:MAG: hypothetical protein AAB871_02885 [Patescibacteria group bacterium]
MKNEDFKKILSWLSRVLICPTCRGHYSSESTRLISQKTDRQPDESSVVVHSDCRNCRTSVTFNISLIGSDMLSIGTISDLTASDAVKFHRAKPLSPDEIIAGHLYLSNFEGDFEKALEKTL